MRSLRLLFALTGLAVPLALALRSHGVKHLAPSSGSVPILNQPAPNPHWLQLVHAVNTPQPVESVFERTSQHPLTDGLSAEAIGRVGPILSALDNMETSALEQGDTELLAEVTSQRERVLIALHGLELQGSSVR